MPKDQAIAWIAMIVIVAGACLIWVVRSESLAFWTIAGAVIAALIAYGFRVNISKRIDVWQRNRALKRSGNPTNAGEERGGSTHNVDSDQR